MTDAQTDRLVRLLGPWRTDGEPAATTLTKSVAELIDGAHLPAGQRMPGQRELATALGVARGTVARAYASLIDSGRVVTRHGSGTYVRRRPSSGAELDPGSDARLASFDVESSSHATIDLSSGALSGSRLVAQVMPEVGRLLSEHHLQEAGYHPAGLPELRTAIASMITHAGLATTADEVLITAGSQQAVWLIATALTEPGGLVVVEDPTYRGALEAFRSVGARLRGVPLYPGGVDTDLLREAARGADLAYLQPALHNPTGIHHSLARRRRIAESVESVRYVIDDQSSADLPWSRSQRLHGLEGLTEPAQLLMVGTFSKLFWGGIRVGWVRADRGIIRRLTEVRRGIDLGGSVTDQLAAVLLLPHAQNQRDARRTYLSNQFAQTTETIEALLPGWAWWLPAGGSGLWVDTGTDATALAQRVMRRGVRLTAGPTFSPHSGQRTFLRLPLWHPTGQVFDALSIMAKSVTMSIHDGRSDAMNYTASFVSRAPGERRALE